MATTLHERVARARARTLPPVTPVRRLPVWLTAALIVWLLLWASLLIDFSAVRDLQPGEPSTVSVTAERTVSYVSAWRTEQERISAENSPGTVITRRDPTIPVQQRAQLLTLLQTVAQIRDDPTIGRDGAIAQLAALPSNTLVISNVLAVQIYQLEDSQWTEVRRRSVELYDRALSTYEFSLDEATVRNLRQLSLPYWASLAAAAETRELMVLLSGAFLKANNEVNIEATRQAKQVARDAVSPVTVRVQSGESVVRQGDLVTPDVIERLEALGKLRSSRSPLQILGYGVIALLCAAIYAAAIAIPNLSRARGRSLVLLTALTILTAVIVRLVLSFGTLAAAIPITTTGLLVAALYGRIPAVAIVALLTLYVASLTDGAVDAMAAIVLGAAAGVIAMRRVERSLDFISGGALGGLVAACTWASFQIISANGWDASGFWRELLLGTLAGTAAGVVALGLYNTCGPLAGLVTPLRLMELAHPARPLLRKLIRAAPGTYYHSVSVGNLAESAAEAVGADALLLRVASYYHDIGKSIRPYFFTDNQSDRGNVHQELDPRTSAEIIIDHVREGIKMAHTAGLPQPIIDFIRTHHGSGMVRHFYNLALQQSDDVDPADFTYPGPKPQTREQGIMMLADTVEATVRAKVQHGKVISAREGNNGTPRSEVQTLEELVNELIDERVASGQLDECPLTLQDIRRIRVAFVTTLQGIHHPRVEYAQSGRELRRR